MHVAPFIRRRLMYFQILKCIFEKQTGKENKTRHRENNKKNNIKTPITKQQENRKTNS